MITQLNNLYKNARILFVIDNCPQCAKFKEFIERANLLVPINKRVRVIDCTAYNSLNIVDYNIIKLFDKFMEGNFPFLFFDGKLLQGVNTRVEAEAYITSAFHKDLIVPKNNLFRFERECHFIRKGIKKMVVCD